MRATMLFSSLKSSRLNGNCRGLGFRRRIEAVGLLCGALVTSSFVLMPQPSPGLALENPQGARSAANSTKDQPFSMSVEDVFSIKGRGPVVTGQVRLGRVSVGDEIDLISSGCIRRVRVRSIELFRKRVASARQGDHVAIALEGVTPREVQRGDQLAYPKSINVAAPRGNARAEDFVTVRIIQITAAHLGISSSSVSPNSRFIEDLHGDSLDQVELIMAIEEEFGIEIPDADAERILTVKDAVAFVRPRYSAPMSTCLKK